MDDPTQNDTELTEPKKIAAVACYKKHFGNIKKACKEVGINRSTFHDWRNTDPSFKKALESIKYDYYLYELSREQAERLICGYKYKEVKTQGGKVTETTTKYVQPNAQIIKFIMETQGNADGYGKKVELTGKNDTPLFDNINITIVHANKGDKDV